MKVITATALARNLSQVLDNLDAHGEDVLIERNHRLVARLTATPGRQNALEALSDVYRTLPPGEGSAWEADSRMPDTLDDLRDPWQS